MVFCIVGIVNAVNLTDGLDGLASSVTFVVTLGFLIISAMLGYAGTTLFSCAKKGESLRESLCVCAGGGGMGRDLV